LKSRWKKANKKHGWGALVDGRGKKKKKQGDGKGCGNPPTHTFSGETRRSWVKGGEPQNSEEIEKRGEKTRKKFLGKNTKEERADKLEKFMKNSTKGGGV